MLAFEKITGKCMARFDSPLMKQDSQLSLADSALVAVVRC